LIRGLAKTQHLQKERGREEKKKKVGYIGRVIHTKKAKG